MARKFLTAIDLVKNELQNAAVQNLGTAPSAPVKGQLYFDSTGNILYWWNGTAWVSAAGGITFAGITPQTTFGLASTNGVAGTAARSDHAHGTPAHSAAEHASIPISALSAAVANVSMGGFTLTNVATPVAATDAANKGYVDNAIAGLNWKDSVRAASVGNLTLSAAQTIDGVAVIVGDRVLAKDQTTQSQNGIYVVAAGAWTRATDADAGPELVNCAAFVEEGTVNLDTAWVCSANAPITVGTTALPFAQFAGGGTITAGAGMTQTGNAFNVIGDASITVAADLISRAALTGDVTAAAGANATTIANDAVTNAKLANMNVNTIKARVTAGTGDPEDITAAQLAFIMGGLLGRVAIFNSSAATSTVCTHNFNTRDVSVAVYRNTTPWDTIAADEERTDANNVTVRFAAAVAAAEYRIVVQG